MGGTFDKQGFGWFGVSTLLLRGWLESVGWVGFLRLVHTIGSWRPSQLLLTPTCGCYRLVTDLLTLGYGTRCPWRRDRPYVENYTVDASIFQDKMTCTLSGGQSLSCLEILNNFIGHTPLGVCF